MKKLSILLAVLLLSCSRDIAEPPSGKAPEVQHGMIELGEKLEDPYTVENMQKALRRLYPTKADRVDIHPTDLYVRFLPSSDEELKLLESRGLYLMDHPMDYRIVREGDYYKDPSLGEEAITWQYAVVPHGFDFPGGVRYELLDRCYISEHDPDTRAASTGIDWTLVEKEAFALTGNAGMWVPPVKSASGAPEGRITFSDPAFCDGRPVGVPGVMVACNIFVKIATAYTDRDGYYKMGTAFGSEPRYRLVFKNQAGFSIGMNLVLVPASVSTLGSGSPEGVDYEITEGSDPSLFRRTAVNNAAWDYMSRCKPEDLDIDPPPADVRIWIIPFLKNSSAPMLHHGAVLEHDLVKQYVGSYAPAVAMFLPDITIGTSESSTFADIYSSTVHEMAHTSHFVKAGKAAWTSYIAYVVKSFVTEGMSIYGSGPGAGILDIFREGASICEIGEMWAYFLSATLKKDRYGGPMPNFPDQWWFRPEILGYLYERGFTRAELFRGLGSSVRSIKDYKEELIRLYPERDWLIRQTFEAYRK